MGNKTQNQYIKIIDLQEHYEKIGTKLFYSLKKDKLIVDKITKKERKKEFHGIIIPLEVIPKIKSFNIRDNAKTAILLSCYLMISENIKNLISNNSYIRIFDYLKSKGVTIKTGNKKVKIIRKGHITLSPAIRILEEYLKYKKIPNILKFVDADLRNSIAHMDFELKQKSIKYKKSKKSVYIEPNKLMKKVLRSCSILWGLKSAKVDTAP